MGGASKVAHQSGSPWGKPSGEQSGTARRAVVAPCPAVSRAFGYRLWAESELKRASLLDPYPSAFDAHTAFGDPLQGLGICFALRSEDARGELLARGQASHSRLRQNSGAYVLALCYKLSRDEGCL